MSDSWWRGKEQLDNDQKKVITLPEDKSYLVTGPPGSGKTNLLMLRANFLFLADRTNILVIVFTRTLKEFIASAGAKYDFPESKIVTSRRWQQEFLREHGVSFDDAPNEFDASRKYFLERIQSVIDRKKLENQYDAIFLDEAQDYLPEEIIVFRKLAKVLFCVADHRQKLYQGDDAIPVIQSIVDDTISLKYHYRNGLCICKVADAIAKHNDSYIPLAETSHYDATTYPPSVDYRRCGSLDEQIDVVLEKLDVQLSAYPENLLGVISPTIASTNAIWNRLSSSRFAAASMLQLGRDREPFDGRKSVCVATFAAAKGLEFRALHMVGCDELKSFSHNRNMAFTGVTRAKTSLSLYSSADIHGYLQSALDSLRPIGDLPDLDDVFRVRRK